MQWVRCSILSALALLVYCNLASSDGIPNPSRPPMGHIAKLPGAEEYNLFKQFFRVLLMNELAQKDGLTSLYKDDWRNFSPTNAQCVRYLKEFIDNKYRLKEFLDLIFLDSCLGYLYDDHQYKWSDQTSAKGKETLESLIADEKLRKIYSGTKLEALSPNGAKFFQDLFNFGLSMIFAKSLSCAGNIRLVTSYAQGRHLFGKPEEDTYVDLMSDVAKRIGQYCFVEEAKDFSERLSFIRYDTRLLNLKNFLPSPARRQLVQYDWQKKLLKLLQIFMGLSSSAAIDFDQLQLFASHLKESDPQAQQQLMSNLGKYANSKLERESSISQEAAQANYKELKDGLCKDYITDISQNWIQLLSYRDLFGDMELLLYEYPEKFFTSKIRTMYLTTFMCRYIDMTYATASTSGYIIELPKDSAKIMQIWPMSPPSQEH